MPLIGMAATAAAPSAERSRVRRETSAWTMLKMRFSTMQMLLPHDED